MPIVIPITVYGHAPVVLGDNALTALALICLPRVGEHPIVSIPYDDCGHAPVLCKATAFLLVLVRDSYPGIPATGLLNPVLAKLGGPSLTQVGSKAKVPSLGTWCRMDPDFLQFRSSAWF